MQRIIFVFCPRKSGLGNFILILGLSFNFAREIRPVITTERDSLFLCPIRHPAPVLSAAGLLVARSYILERLTFPSFIAVSGII